MKNLGELITFLLISSTVLFASLEVSVDSKTITLGESVTLNLKVNGSDVSVPSVSKLCGVDVEGTSKSTSINFINMKKNVSSSYGFSFTPTKSCTVDSISLVIDGKLEKSEPN